jgi:hypothetical protein
LASWAWGLSLIALTMAIHGTGLVWVAVVLEVLLGRLTAGHAMMKIIVLIGTVGLLLAALHVFEAGLWALAYWWVGAVGSPADALLYSVDTISTRGGSGLTIGSPWQLMGALEAVDGMLLFGISTAFIFAFIQRYWVTMNPRGQP